MYNLILILCNSYLYKSTGNVSSGFGSALKPHSVCILFFAESLAANVMEDIDCSEFLGISRPAGFSLSTYILITSCA